jgi:hypothetical protein
MSPSAGRVVNRDERVVFKSEFQDSLCVDIGSVYESQPPFRQTTIALIDKKLIHHMKYVRANERKDG